MVCNDMIGRFSSERSVACRDSQLAVAKVNWTAQRWKRKESTKRGRGGGRRSKWEVCRGDEKEWEVVRESLAGWLAGGRGAGLDWWFRPMSCRSQH